MTRVMGDQAVSLVRERDRRRLRAMVGVLAVGGLLVGSVLGYVWLQVQRVRVSYELEDLRALRTDVEDQNRKLRLELYSLRSLARVDSAARRLGLTEPARDQVRLAREFVSGGSGEEQAMADGSGVRTAARDEPMRGRP
jgi:cell division protein FtsL